MKKLARVHPQPLTTDFSGSLSHDASALSPTAIHAQDTHTVSPHLHDVVELQRRRNESAILQTLRRLEISLDRELQEECQPMLNILRRRLKADTVVLAHGNVHRVLFDCRHGSPSLFDALTLLQIIREQEMRENENALLEASSLAHKENSIFSSISASISAKIPTFRTISHAVSHSRPVTAMSRSFSRSTSHSAAHSISRSAAHSLRNTLHSESSHRSKRSFFSTSMIAPAVDEDGSENDTELRTPMEPSNTQDDMQASTENNRPTAFVSPLSRSLVYSRDLQTDRRISQLSRTNLDGKIRFFLSTRVRLGPALFQGKGGLFTGDYCEFCGEENDADDGSSFQSSSSSSSVRCHYCNHTHSHHHSDKSDRTHWCTLLVLASSPRTVLSSADLEIFAEISALLEQTYTSHVASHCAQTSSSLSLGVSFLSSLQPTLREMHVAAERVRCSYEVLFTQQRKGEIGIEKTSCKLHPSGIIALSDALHSLSEANARFTEDFERIMRCVTSYSPVHTPNTLTQHSPFGEVCANGLTSTLNEVLLSLARRHALSIPHSVSHKSRSQNVLSRMHLSHNPTLTHTNALLWQYSSSLTPTFARCVHRTSHDFLSLFLSVLIASGSAFACTTQVTIDFEFVRMDKYYHFDKTPDVSRHGSSESAAALPLECVGDREAERGEFASVVEGVLRVCVHFPDKVRLIPEKEVLAVFRRIEVLFAWMNASSPAVAQTLLCGREEEDGDPVVPSSSTWSSLARWNELSHISQRPHNRTQTTHDNVGEAEAVGEVGEDDRVRVYSLRLPCTMLLTAAQREAMMVSPKTKMHVALHWGARGAYNSSETKSRLRQRKERKLARAKESALQGKEQEEKAGKSRVCLPFLCFLRYRPTFFQRMRQRREREKEELLDLGFSRGSRGAKKKKTVRGRNRKPK